MMAQMASRVRFIERIRESNEWNRRIQTGTQWTRRNISATCYYTLHLPTGDSTHIALKSFRHANSWKVQKYCYFIHIRIAKPIETICQTLTKIKSPCGSIASTSLEIPKHSRKPTDGMKKISATHALLQNFVNHWICSGFIISFVRNAHS